MYCHHCANYINEHKVEAKKSSYSVSSEIKDDTAIEYVCPRCGHLVKSNLSKSEIKELAQSSHAELQRGRNFFASGMCLNVLGIICFAIAFIFFLLAKKPTNQYQLTVCTELYVSIAVFVLCLGLLVVGVIFVIRSIKVKRMYTALLKDINNQTFVQ